MVKLGNGIGNDKGLFCLRRVGVGPVLRIIRPTTQPQTTQGVSIYTHTLLFVILFP